MKRPWSQSEIDTLKTSRQSVPELAARLGRTIRSVQGKRHALGLTFDRRAEYGAEFEVFLRQHHAKGWTDQEIAEAWGGERDAVGRYRRSLGLPASRYNARHVSKCRKAAKEQLLHAGCKSLNELKQLSHSIAAVRAGWPEYCTPFMVRVLEAMEAGAVTYRQICERLGKRYRDGALCSNNQSVMSALVTTGAVRRVGRHYELLISRSKLRPAAA